jgi:hypothetical protein
MERSRPGPFLLSLSPAVTAGHMLTGTVQFVLLTLVVNVVTALVQGGNASRFARALKAFRALRLVNLSSRLRSIFYDVIIVGFRRIL